MEKNTVIESTELEDGEIEFDASFEDIYIPLERPSCNAPVSSDRVIESDRDRDNECPTSSDSDSSDASGRGNRPKMKRKESGSTVNESEKKRSNRTIWCEVLQGESVSNILTNCNLDESQKRIRGLLPYTRNERNFEYSEKGNQNFGKRNYGGNFITSKKTFKDNNMNPKKGSSKCISPLPEKIWENEEVLAKEIANKLNEVKHDLILNAIKIAGKDRIIPIFNETREIEKSGGMLIMNGSRRRTSGGVFFYLLKTSEDIPMEQLKNIFLTDKQDLAAQKKARQRKQLQNLSKA